MTGFVSLPFVAVAISGGVDSAVTAATPASERSDRVRVHFEMPQRAIAPGRATVFYGRGESDRLIGGVRIGHDAGARYG